jgi:hypothetical protein
VTICTLPEYFTICEAVGRNRLTLVLTPRQKNGAEMTQSFV